MKRIGFLDKIKDIGEKYYKETEQACEGVILDYNTYHKLYGLYNRLRHINDLEAITVYRLKFHQNRIIQIFSMAVFVDYTKKEEHIQFITVPPELHPEFKN